MIKKYIGTGLVALGLVFSVGFAAPAQAAALTSAQVQAVISLLQSFGVDASTIANVHATLGGSSNGLSCNTFADLSYGNFDTSPDGRVSQLQTWLGIPSNTFGFGTYGPKTQALWNSKCPVTTYTPTNTQTTPITIVSAQPSISVTKVSLPSIYISYSNLANTEVDLINQSSGIVVHNEGINGATGATAIQVQQSLSPGYYFFRVLKKYGDGGTLVESAPFQIGNAQPSLSYSLRILAGSPGDTWYEGSNIDGLALTVSNGSQLTQTLTFPTSCKYTYTLTNESGQVVFDLGSTQSCTPSVSSITLNPGQEYSFPITHLDSQFHLKPGKYVMNATVKDSYGTGTAQTYFYVKAANPTCTLSAKPYMPATGENTTLSWSSQNATSLMWQQDSAANLLGLPAGILSASGAQSFQVSGKSGQLTITLLAYGKNGSAGSCNTTLSVQ